jgi:hypothetical protein
MNPLLEGSSCIMRSVAYRRELEYEGEFANRPQFQGLDMEMSRHILLSERNWTMLVARYSDSHLFIQSSQKQNSQCKGLCRNNGVGIYRRLICTSGQCSSKRDLVTCLDWGLQMGLMCCTETSVRNYHYSLRNDPEELGSQQFRGGSLVTRKNPT